MNSPQLTTAGSYTLLTVLGWAFTVLGVVARHTQFRADVAGGKPSEIKIFVQVRKFDDTAEAPVSVKFAWPA